jgi:hypothetical protein
MTDSSLIEFLQQPTPEFPAPIGSPCVCFSRLAR